MQSFGDVGDCSSPLGVVASLGANDVAEDTSATGDGGTGVVEGCFDAKDGWFHEGYYS